LRWHRRGAGDRHDRGEPGVVNFAALAFLAIASVSVHPSAANRKLVDVAIVRAPLSEAVQALELHLRHRVQIVLSGERRVTFSARGVAPEAALGAAAPRGGAEGGLAD